MKTNTTDTEDIHITDHHQQRINKSINNLTSRRWTTPNFQMPNFHRTDPGRETALQESIANCPSKNNCQHNNCNKRHNTLLHRDSQIAGNSSQLTGTQGFRTNNRHQPPEISHNKTRATKEELHQFTWHKRNRWTTAFKGTQKRKTTEQRHINQQPPSRFYQSTPLCSSVCSTWQWKYVKLPHKKHSKKSWNPPRRQQQHWRLKDSTQHRQSTVP